MEMKVPRFQTQNRFEFRHLRRKTHRLKLLLTGALFTTQFAWAQTTDIVDLLEETPQEQFDFIAQNLDLSEIRSGLLVDKALPLSAIGKYNGQQLNSENLADGLQFCMMYAMLSSMNVRNNGGLPAPKSYTEVVANARANQVLMAGVHYTYEQIKEDALQSNLLAHNGGQLFDVPGRTASPYTSQEAFLVTPVKGQVDRLENEFIFPANLFYSNTGKTIAKIKVDFDDGRGRVLLKNNQSHSVKYASEGTKTIKTFITYTDQTVRRAHAKLEVRLPVQQKYNWASASPDHEQLINAVTPYDGEYGSATIRVHYACGHDNIQKPFIWVEGFNPTLPGLDMDYGYSTMRSVLLSGAFGGMTLEEYCDAEGYDLIYVDFTDGGDWLQKNAYVVQEVIRWANNQKHANYSDEETVVLGESMGGVIAKYALRKMELAGEDHETSEYISLDAPHQGANIPLSFQYAAKHIPYINVGGSDLHEFVTFIANFDAINGFQAVFDLTLNLPDALGTDMRVGEWVLNTRAARQMVIYRAPDNFFNQTGTNLKSTTHLDFYSDYHGLGDLTQCETYMMTNGSPDGPLAGQGFAPEETVLRFHFDGTTIDNAIVNNTDQGFLRFLVGGDIDFNLKALPHYSTTNKEIYKGKLSVNVLGIIPIVYTNKKVKVRKVRPYDSAPGGRYDLTIAADIDLATEPDLATAVGNGNILVDIAGFNFIPAFSGIDLPSTYADDPYAVLTNLSLMNSLSSAKRVVLSDEPISATTIFQQPITAQNSNHTYFYPSSSLWFGLHLIGNDEINASPTWSSGSFNFGRGNFGTTSNYTNTDFKRTTNKMDKLQNITSGAQVYINTNNRIGNIGSGIGTFTVLGTAANPQNFTVSIKKACDGTGGEVLVDDNGLLYIGYNAHTRGTLKILPGATLRIGNGGKLYLAENSKIIIYPGGKLILENGSLVVNEGSIEMWGYYDTGVSAWDGGQLEYQDGADIKLEHVNAQIHFNGGNLLIKENATFTFRHNTGPSGHLRFSKWGKHIFGENNTRFRIRGDGLADPIVILEKNADFWTNNMLDYVKIDDGKVLFEQNSRLVSVPRYFSGRVTYQNNPGTSINRGIVLFKHSSIHRSVLNEVPIYAPFYYAGTARLSMYFNEVNNTLSDKAIELKGGGYTIGDTEFNTDQLYVIHSKDMTLPSRLYNSTLTADISSGAVTTGVLDDSEVEVHLSRNTFVNSYVSAMKANGVLRLTCNHFKDFVHGAVYGLQDCRIRMNSENFSGYNIFEKYYSGAENMHLFGAQALEINDGYNSFDDPEDDNAGSPGPIILGTMRPIVPTATINAQRNKWDPVFGVAPAFDFNITNDFAGGATIGVDASVPAASACGAHNPPGGGVIVGVPVSALPAQLNFSFGIVGLADAVELATSRMETFGQGGNDLQAVDMFAEILRYNYGNTNVPTKQVLASAQSYMEQALRGAIDKGTLSIASNANQFDGHVQGYVNALNFRSSQPVNNSNYEEQFDLEMAKANFLHVLGKRNQALLILENMESCGVKRAEQYVINKMKKMLETEMAKLAYGYEAEFIDTTWVDTSDYIHPGQQNTFGDFGSFILSPNSVSAGNCSNAKTQPASVMQEVSLEVFPNPATAFVNVRYALEDEQEGRFVLYDVLGQEVQTLMLQNQAGQETIQVSNLAKGAYTFTYFVDGVMAKTGKVLVQ